MDEDDDPRTDVPSVEGEFLLERSVSAKILTLGNLLRRSGNLRYKRMYGLSLTEFRILSHVAAHAPLSLNRVADHAGLDKTQMSREVKNLVAQGLIVRGASQRNQAEAEIALTPAGEALWVELAHAARQRARDIAAPLGDTELTLLVPLLDRLTAQARQVLRAEQAAAQAEPEAPRTFHEAGGEVDGR